MSIRLLRDKDKVVKIDPITSEVVKRIFKMYLEGKSYYRISEIFNDKKVLYPRDKEWTEASIRTIVYNQIYVGDYIRNKTSDNEAERVVYENVVAPIITRAEWEEYCIYFEEITDKILKNVPEQNKKYVQKQLEQLEKNFMDYLYYWNEKYYRNGFADVIELFEI